MADNDLYAVSYRNSSPYDKFTIGMMNLETAMAYIYTKPLTKDLLMPYSTEVTMYITPNSTSGGTHCSYDMTSMAFIRLETFLVYRYFTKVEQVFNTFKIYNSPNRMTEKVIDDIVHEFVEFAGNDALALSKMILRDFKKSSTFDSDKYISYQLLETIRSRVISIMYNDFNLDELEKYLSITDNMHDTLEDCLAYEENGMSKTKLSLTGAADILVKYIYYLEDARYKGEPVSIVDLLSVFVILIMDGIDMYLEDLYWRIKND